MLFYSLGCCQRFPESSSSSRIWVKRLLFCWKGAIRSVQLSSSTAILRKHASSSGWQLWTATSNIRRASPDELQRPGCTRRNLLTLNLHLCVLTSVLTIYVNYLLRDVKYVTVLVSRCSFVCPFRPQFYFIPLHNVACIGPLRTPSIKFEL